MLDDEASNVSAAEKQLLTIARAFLARPSVLILDEATSSVDTRTEVLVQKALKALRSDRTSFVIAHRLSTIRDADLILVMEVGSIVEQGTHSDRLAAEGDYFRLFNAQFAEPAEGPATADPRRPTCNFVRFVSCPQEIPRHIRPGLPASATRCEPAGEDIVQWWCPPATRSGQGF